MRTPTIEEALHSWHTLNAALRGCTEAYAGKLFTAEMKGQRRPQMLRRIHARINRLRGERERSKLERISTRSHRLRNEIGRAHV